MVVFRVYFPLTDANQLVVLARQGRIATVYLDGAQQELVEIHELLAAVLSKGR